MYQVGTQFTMPPPGDAAKQFNMAAQLQSLWYAMPLKLGSNKYTIILVLM